MSERPIVEYVPDYSDLHVALVNIAQYDQRWQGQHANDAPSRQQLIARAYDALFPPAHNNTSGVEP